jgi:organic radical activating enzyme
MVQKIKVSELFYSIQGEGRYVGVPSIFLRTFGCNFTCGGFGMPAGWKSQERNMIDPANFKTYKELPLVSTGCDSYASWDPRFKHLSPLIPVDALAKSIVDLLPYKEWRYEHLVITGGEPLLGWQRAFPELLNQPEMHKLKELTFETNGTQKLSQEFVGFLLDWGKFHAYDELTFSVSPKLSASGERWEDAVQPNIVKEYEELGYTYLKFVVEREKHIPEVLHAIDVYREAGFKGPVYLMPVGGTEAGYYLNNKAVAELAMKYGLRYSPRLQVDLFKNSWGT